MIAERGSLEAGAVWDAADRRISSLLLYPEARAALARADRARRVRHAELEAAGALLERFWEDIDRLQITTRLARRAGDLAEEQALRAYDAVHLASAELVADTEAVLVSSDRDLLGAAQSLGLGIVSLPA